MSAKVKIQVDGRDLELWYGDRGWLEGIQDSDGKMLLMSFCLEGRGVFLGKAGMMGGTPVNGPMVNVKGTNILVPYYLFFLADFELPSQGGW